MIDARVFIAKPPAVYKKYTEYIIVERCPLSVVSSPWQPVFSVLQPVISDQYPATSGARERV